MRFSLALMAGSLLFFTACRKTTETVQPEAEQAAASVHPEVEDHVTMTPEREAIVEAFKSTPRTEVITVYLGFTIDYVGNVSASVRTRM